LFLYRMVWLRWFEKIRLTPHLMLYRREMGSE